ncbi:MAG: peptidyl-prolyl cis-trans isomerase [Desulfobacula sp.]|jgi:peptidyl-prolyl cis-trans isomerase D|uniref:peptidylprolyl isomerase n=1 Tax=Desulfobacula sp. TaxID=2593537 RepID=UPI001D55A438|nr:peptidyl-prolyl cis-trans isomerase [Desulfobacula sp.]MBT3486445.1 peptidyl-prolyl cis-trans isomerase [Desulfobacula sp.]MBT3805066.1 peptidyl-prolyl cis-trans isomerase [Desulfobacula sp.]MBT4025568.1 peptidyl-prolyl cis-trans isomerase [Desulfobacula sp.]MBT4199704.1 peptidyl-prolyl cis-trans isomerase [Desulfobacula sp.]
MLRYLRENTGNWIIKIFLGIIVVVFVFLGVGSFGSKRNDSIATINDESITIKEYQQAYKTIVDQMRARFGKNLNDDILKMFNVKQQALDSLIEQKLVLAQADKLEINVSENELQESLLSIKAFQKDGRFDLDQYKKVLSLNSLNPEIFEYNQLNAIRQQKVKDIVFSTVNISDFEARDWYVYNNTETAVDYMLFDPSGYSDILPDEEQIKAFYDENKENYKSELRVKSVYLKFSPEDYKDKIKVTDANIKDFYEQNPEQFKTPQKVEARHILIKVAEDAEEEKVNEAQKRAQDIFDMASKGQDFELLAKEYSEGPSKDKGGYLGIFEKQSMVKPFADKAFSMKEGEISNPVRTIFGWHIIKLMAKFDASVQTMAMASETIKKELEQQEMQNMAYYKAGEAFDAVIDGDDFEQVALIANKKLVSTKDFDINGNGLEIEDNKGFANEAFSLTLDTISDVKEIGDSYYLIKVVKKIDPEFQNLDLVSEKVLKDLTLTLQVKQAKEDAQLIIDKISDGKTLEQLARDHELSLKSTKFFKRNTKVEEVGNSPEFIKASFSLNKTNKIHPEIIEVSSKYYILGFKEKKSPEEDEILENIKTIKSEISASKQSQYYQAWINELKNNSKINFDPEILN